MTYPKATAEDVEFFKEHGYIVVRDAIDPADMIELEAFCQRIIEGKENMAFDWAWDSDKSKDEREFRILQSSPSHMLGADWSTERYRVWAIEFASTLMGNPVEFWYDQFLAKPPDKSVPTPWHQDEGYWGRNLNDRGITCWMPFQDVDETNGCMHFIDGGHKRGVLEHFHPENVQSDLLYCEPDESKMVSCPIAKGSVTFHHSKMPHMTTANRGTQWRRALTQHLKVVGTNDEPDHYPWVILVNQLTGERVVPAARR